MNYVIEVWSRSGETFEAIACIVLEIQPLETRRVGLFIACVFRKTGVYCTC